MATYYVDYNGTVRSSGKPSSSKKKKKQQDNVTYSVDYGGKVTHLADVAPTKAITETKKKEDNSKLDFFQKGSFEDGYQLGDISKAILGTAGDAGVGILKGGLSLGEGIIDAGKYAVAGVADVFENDDYAKKVRENAKKNSINEAFKGTDEFLDKYSVLGRTSDLVMEGLGQVATIIGTGGLAGLAGLGGLV